MPQLPLTLIPVVVIEFFLINLHLFYTTASTAVALYLFNLRNDPKEKLWIINVFSSGTLFGTGNIHLCGNANPLLPDLVTYVWMLSNYSSALGTWEMQTFGKYVALSCFCAAFME